ncbi:alpha/beta fold hydrolase [Legionella micdadei]|uniref:Pimeloyl-[acyl-carrier protein] methyl ester esterase n=1 Tax=Legionella micdadei TaxID=451 RepID=A0A098GFY5_LEGMI|nr:alpha/beta fold hydrolase [Legionella micdadei]ARH00147.1 pimelyl-ACP methyl ester esterase [Legionella micdadei]KTD27617.1 biotin biosynthesis protein BioH [Legionella micdadei]NSL17600.1 alpha/beta fold hydrolase [Legionella micdadei]CEG60897.1 Carboxylesterase BioH [Legionella micdadei]SCY16558.1 pimeloyl-[acyl-carrier protein] methyl ester esterase [Legionella micdadei]
MNLHVIIKGQGRPLVLFHGWGFDHNIWLQLAHQIDREYQLFLVDLPGFGLSSQMSWEIFKQNLLKYLPQQFSVVGWSMGGLFATRLAIEEPNRVIRLVNIASSPRFIKEQDWPGVEQAVFEQFFMNLATSPRQTITEFIGLQLKDQTYRCTNTPMPDATSLKKGLEILKNWDLREQLHSYTKPAYFLFGRLDAITPRSTMAVMQKIYPQFRYFMFAKAAHMPFLSHENEFIALLKDILP